MNKYLITTTEVYRVPTVEDVKALHEEFKTNAIYALVSFSYKTKYDKKTDKEYQVVTVKKSFQSEKEVYYNYDVIYEGVDA